MSEPYVPLNQNELNGHLSNSLAGYYKPYPSGEGHFFDFNQSDIAELYDEEKNIITTATSGIFDRNGLISPFSDGLKSRDYAITNFKTFNPYRHYVSTGKLDAGFDNAYQINISGLLTKSTYEFNIYSTAFRT